jgi:hypothetical protein
MEKIRRIVHEHRFSGVAIRRFEKMSSLRIKLNLVSMAHVIKPSIAETMLSTSSGDTPENHTF